MSLTRYSARGPTGIRRVGCYVPPLRGINPSFGEQESCHAFIEEVFDDDPQVEVPVIESVEDASIVSTSEEGKVDTSQQAGTGEVIEVSPVE
ncbi:hypothetical protein CVT26_003343 [Gymnopilus dilepis]|uniref:Uncharacterized protein n=1 Tax=Gymnopilus dilepis TaxID=231916 RepID=A0A409W2T4_9AGAR|nr:hypothetical protein CVT26_003343 [Gymnopilus dilepis]